MLKFITDDGEIVHCDRVASISYGENCIFIISIGKKILFNMESEAIEYIEDFIKRKMVWNFKFDVLYDKKTNNFYINIINMKVLQGQIVPFNTFSIQFTEDYVFHFNINTKITITYEHKYKETKTEIVEFIPNSTDFPTINHGSTYKPKPIGNISSYSSIIKPTLYKQIKQKPINVPTDIKHESLHEPSLSVDFSNTRKMDIKEEKYVSESLKDDKIRNLLTQLIYQKKSNESKQQEIIKLQRINEEQEEIIRLFEATLFFSLKMEATAFSFVASQPKPQTVSVG